ncbi:MAG: hypothetical protein KDK65_04045 [Chlamydiia bacterium]|nr:hypothetical protein [Chlamydiia bacterium]
MKRIQIAQRLRPFTHVPGAKIVLPGTREIVQCFPSQVIVEGGKTFTLPHEGPCLKWMAMQDLERGEIKLFGQTGHKHFRYTIQSVTEGPKEGKLTKVRETPLERLSLGSHKKQEWEGIVKRGDLKEILPLWFFLGQYTPPAKENIQQVEDLLHLFRARFTSLFCPVTHDINHWGYDFPPAKDPFEVLSYGARQIRSLFVREGVTIELCSPRFSCGRMTGIQTRFGIVHFEWSEKRIRRVQLEATSTGVFAFTLPKEIKHFRLDRQQRYHPGESIEITAGQFYTFDHFER